MAATDGLPPMRPVRVEDVPEETGPLASPRASVPWLIGYVLVIAGGFVATTVWHVSHLWLLVVAAVVAVVASTIEVGRAIRRRRRQR